MAVAGIPDDYIYFLRNGAAINKCAPLLYTKFINLVWTKTDTQTIGQYLNDNDLFTKSKTFSKPATRNNWITKNQSKLDQTNLDNLDVTFLHELLPIICYEKISSPGKVAYNDKLKDPNSFESCLKKVKDMRNDFSHEPQRAQDKNLFQDLQNDIHACIDAFSKLYAIIDISRVRDIKDEFDSEFSTIIEKTTKDYDSRIRFIRDLLEKDCLEMLRVKSEKISIPLPGSSNVTIDIDEISIKMSIRKEANKKSFHCNEIFDNLSENVAIFNGSPGSGKTTLLRMIYREILAKNPNSKFVNLGKFHLPFYISCRTDKFSSLGEYLKAVFPKYFSCFEKDEVLDALRELDGVVFLIDGYDESNNISMALVNEAISYCVGIRSGTCIITSRVQAAFDVQEDLKVRSIKYDSFAVDNIVDTTIQIDYLKAFSNKLPNCNESNVVECFRELNDNCRDIFTTPLLLALFSSLFVDRDYDCQIVNVLDIYQALYKSFVKQIEEKLKQDGTPDAMLCSRTIMSILTKYSLKGYNLRQYYITEDNYLNLLKDCKAECPDVKNIDRILACVLTPEMSMNSNDVNQYHFQHLSIQEYLSVKKLSRDFAEVPATSEVTLEQFLEKLGLNINDKKVSVKMFRYENLLRLLILQICSERTVSRISTSANKVMTEFIRPCVNNCLDLISSANYNETTVEMFSAYVDKSDGYIIFSASQLTALKECLKLEKRRKFLPKSLNASPPPKRINLNFEQSYENFQPLSDEMFRDLREMNCEVSSFKGCINSNENLKVLTEKSGGMQNMHVSFPLMEDLNLKILSEASLFTIFQVKYSGSSSYKTMSSLHRGWDDCPPYLYLVDVPAHAQENAFHIIRHLAPDKSSKDSRTFNWLYLQRCSLTFSEAEELRKKLFDSGIRTSNSTKKISSVEITKGKGTLCSVCKKRHEDDTFHCYKLHLTEKWPSPSKKMKFDDVMKSL